MYTYLLLLPRPHVKQQADLKTVLCQTIAHWLMMENKLMKCNHHANTFIHNLSIYSQTLSRLDYNILLPVTKCLTDGG